MPPHLTGSKRASQNSYLATDCIKKVFVFPHHFFSNWFFFLVEKCWILRNAKSIFHSMNLDRTFKFWNWLQLQRTSSEVFVIRGRLLYVGLLAICQSYCRYFVNLKQKLVKPLDGFSIEPCVARGVWMIIDSPRATHNSILSHNFNREILFF